MGFLLLLMLLLFLFCTLLAPTSHDLKIMKPLLKIMQPLPDPCLWDPFQFDLAEAVDCSIILRVKPENRHFNAMPSPPCPSFTLVYNLTGSL